MGNSDICSDPGLICTIIIVIGVVVLLGYGIYLFATANPLVSFLMIVISIIIICIGYKWYEDKKESLKIDLSKLDKPYIEFFVKKYHMYITDTSGHFGEELSRRKQELWTLLKAKGVKISDIHLNYFIKKELERKEEEDFIRKISYGNPETIEDFYNNFLTAYGENYKGSDVSKLNRFLTEKGLISKHSRLMELINGLEEIKEKRRIGIIEKKLSEEGEAYFDIEKINLMSGAEFEELAARLYKFMGYHVNVTPLIGDQGADLIIEKFGEKTAVQVKRSSTNVGNKAIQEIVAAKSHYNCDKAIVVTNSFFTRPAEELARSNNVKLVNRTELQELIQKYL